MLLLSLRIPTQIRMVSQLPRLDQMSGRKQRPQEHTNATHNHIADSQEWIPAAHDIHGGDDHALCSTIVLDGESIDDIQDVISSRHVIRRILQRKLVEGRQPRRAHPNLELGPFLEVWRGMFIAVFAIRIPFGPQRWRHHLVGLVFRLAVPIPIGIPGNVFRGHGVDALLGGLAGHILEDGREEGVVEHGIGDQAAREVGFSLRVGDERGASIRALEGGGGDCLAGELFLVETLDVATVVLVEVGEPVVEHHWRLDACSWWDVEFYPANVITLYIPLHRVIGRKVSPLGCLRLPALPVCIREFVFGHVCHISLLVGFRSFGMAGCVVDVDFLNLRGGVEEEAADWGEDYAEDEEERKYGLWGEDGSGGSVGGRPFALGGDVLPCF